VGGEHERLEAGRVEPVGVVHHDQDGGGIGAEGQQRQGGRVHREGRRPGGPEAERAGQGVGLHRGQVLEAVEQRTEDGDEAAECEAPLELDAGRPQHGEAAVARGGGRPVEQHRLAGAGVAVEDDHRGPVGDDVVEQPVEGRQLDVAAVKGSGWSCPHVGHARSSSVPFPTPSSLLTCQPGTRRRRAPGSPGEVDDDRDGLADLGQHHAADVAADLAHPRAGDTARRCWHCAADRRSRPLPASGTIATSAPHGRMLEVSGTTWTTDGAASRIRWAVTTTAG
jgi:hypothetical protein